MTNIGIIGAGFMGMIHYLAYQKLGGAKVAALCETDEKRLAGDWTSIKGNFGPQGEMMDLTGIAKYPEVEGMLADSNVEMVDICLPPSLHAPTAIAALEAGKHVFCEKPIALNPADAERMVAAAERAGKMLMIGHVLPFFPEYNFAYKAITGGEFGKLLGGHFKRVISDPTWLPDFYNPATTGGPMLDLHVHDAHFIRLVCGMPASVQSVGSMRGEVVERFTTQFRFADPELVVTAASGVIDQQGRPFTHAYEIYLEKATMFFEYAGLAETDDIVTPLTVLTEDGKVDRPELSSVDAFEAELEEVVSAVEAGTPSPILTGELARDAVILCQKQTQSVEQGQAVRL